MTKRIFNGIFWMTLLTTVICVLFISMLLYEHYSGIIKENIQNRAEYVADCIEYCGRDYLNNISVDDNSRYTLISSEGEVLYDSAANEAQMEDHSDREEFISALRDGSGEAQRYSNTLSEIEYYYAIKLKDGSVLRVSETQRSVWSTMGIVLSPFLILAAAIVLLSAMLANNIAKNIVAPINSMDIKNPEESGCYEELTPLLNRINYQNKKIAMQMEELKHKQNEFSLISDNMSEGLIVIDKDKCVLSANKSILRLFDKDESILGKNILFLDKSNSLKGIILGVMEGRHLSRIQEINGRYYSITANPVCHENAVDGAVILYIDVTEKEERDKLRREFSANVSHELKTPLSSIYGVSDMLMNGIVCAEDVEDFARDINSEAKRLIALIDDIINLSRLDDEDAAIEFKQVDIYNIAEKEALHLEEVANSRGIRIFLHGEHCVINGVGSIIAETAHNLIENAVKYNIDGGRVDVTVVDGDEVILKVADTGIGIASEEQERIFERFYRVDKSHSRRIGGTGLGLSIVKHGVKLHGGRIEIDSALGRGTTICAVFPKY